MKRKSSPRKIIERPNKSGCLFCKEKSSPDYKNFDQLEKFLNDRAKVAGRTRSGLCSYHQRRMAQATKRARHLALLPFSGRI